MLGSGVFLFPPPPSILLTVTSVMGFVALARAGVMEVKGIHMKYSKFRDSAALPVASKRVSGRNGMLIFYTPALTAAIAASAYFGFFDGSLRQIMVQWAVIIHFLKRDLEVLFLHKFGGDMSVETIIPVSTSYFVSSICMIYSQRLAAGMTDPVIDLKYIGFLLFAVGLSGNFYHHYLLANLRKSKDDKAYKIPKGGLFGLVICPHYLFEIIGFVGLTCMSQTFYTLAFTLGTIAYLSGRSIVTRKWYVSKFENFPEGIKALVPYIF